jgi:hypothetical protein
VGVAVGARGRRSARSTNETIARARAFAREESLDQGVRGLAHRRCPPTAANVAPAVEPGPGRVALGARALLERAGAGEIVTLAMSELGGLARVGAVIQQVESSTYHEATLRDSSSLLGDFATTSTARRLRAWAGVLRSRTARKSAPAPPLRKHGSSPSTSSALPTMPSTAPPLDVVAADDTRTIPFNALGWPAVSVPAGRGADGLPLAIQIVGPPWHEARVLCAARVGRGRSRADFSVGAGAG